MSLPPRALFRALALPCALTLWSCQDAPAPTDVSDLPLAPSVAVDFQAGNGSQFLFLPPLAAGKPSAALATGLDLDVTICGSAGCETIAAKQEDDHYQANWKSDKAKAGQPYTVTVTGSGYLDGFKLGELRITLENKGKDKAGSTFPIKFWVGENTPVAAISDCVGDDRCNADAVPPGVQTTITTLDENGATMGEVTFPAASVPAGGLVVTLDCRQGGYAPGDGPLPTALDQWPLFCHVDARNPDGTEFTGTLPGTASIEICVVDELVSGQAPYHGFVDHHDLLLGKSHTGSDFMFLDPGPESLDCAGASMQTASASPVGKVLDALGSKLAWALSPLVPQKLYARAMWFRDGGVGGLVSSFSDINPVEPAVIAGAVTYEVVGTPIPGVPVTLVGGPLTTPMATVTDANGLYSFSPLQAEVGGSAYVVTVGGTETFATPFQVVNVTGSGLFSADFEADVAFSLNTSATWTSSIFGGLGGGPFALTCPAGSVGVGLRGTTGGWTFSAQGVWSLGIECRTLLPDGSLGASTVVGYTGSPPLGYYFGDAPFAGSCTSDQVMTAATSRYNGYVMSEVGASCATVAHVAGGVTSPDSSIGPWSISPGTGTASGAACPAGYAVTGLHGQAGWVVDGLGFVCTQIVG